MFDGFTPEDFDAYLPEKWSSNMFTLPRRRVKDKLEQLGKVLADELDQAGLQLVMHLSDDHPSLWNNKKVDTQWLFFSRDEAAQKKLSEIIDTERTLAATLADPTPLYRHVFLGVSVSQDTLEVGLRLHFDGWVDRKNLLSLLGATEGRDRFAELRASLPDHYEIGVVGDEMVAPQDLDDGALAALAGRFEASGGWLFVGARMPGDQVAVLGPELLETAVETFRLLIPVYGFAAWSPENDAVSMDRLVAERQQVILASQAELDRERTEREARRMEQEARRAELRAEVEERVLQDQAWRQREIAVRRAAARAAAEREAAEAEAAAKSAPETDAKAAAEALFAKPAEPAKPPEPAAATPAAQPSQRPRQAAPRDRPPRRRKPREPRAKIDLEAAVEVGSEVEVLRGFLKGRRGVVQGVDEKGEVRIAFGALVSRLPRGDVAALERG
jgi:hypothetical protein